MNKETLKNSYTRFEQDQIIHVVKSKDAKIPPRIQLDADWQPSRDPQTGALLPQGKLWDFTEKIASSRREGKNRRDGATVSVRVLRLTEELGAKLFTEAEESEQQGKNKVPSRLSLEEQEVHKKDMRRKKKKLNQRPHL